MTHDFEWPWALLAVPVVVVVLLLWWARPARAPAGPALRVAHVARLRALPRFQAMLRRQRALGLVTAAAALLVVAGAAVALARPEVVETQPRAARNRDLMLCLDASPSMARDNVAVVHEVRRIVDGLQGDRIGLVLWSGAAVLVFPLTDDTDYVREQLERAEAAFTGDPDRFFAGTTLNDTGQSLIGDGLVSCVDRFDGASADRTRAVLLASDNDPFGPTLYTLPDAAAYAAQRKVLVYGLAATRLSRPRQATALAEMTEAVQETGGTLAQLGDATGTDRIVQRIDSLERARAVERPRTVSRDSPGPGLVLVGAGMLGLLGCWLAAVLGRRRR